MTLTKRAVKGSPLTEAEMDANWDHVTDGANIKPAYEGQLNTNAFTDAEKTKLAGISAGAEVNDVDSVNGATGAISLDADDISDDATAHKFATAAQLSKLDGVATGATANTGALADLDTVNTAQIEDQAVTAPKINPNAVTLAKIQNILQDTIMGRIDVGAGDPQELTPAQVRTLLGVLTAAILASNTVGEGADLLGAPDPGGFAIGTTVGAQLQEIFAIIDNHGDIVTQDIGTFVRKSEREVIVFDAQGDNNAARPTQASDKTVIWFNHGTSAPANMGPYDFATHLGPGIVPVNTQTGTSYDLVALDSGKAVRAGNAAANTVNIQTDAAESFPLGGTVLVRQVGAGATTIQAPAGVTLNGTDGGSVVVDGQYKSISLHNVAADAWEAEGAIA
jgi:hypothetical protein